MGKTKAKSQPERKPVPFDEALKRLLNTPPPATRKAKAKRSKSK